MEATAQKEHEWLHKLIGEWTTEMEMPAEPGKPADKCRGSERVRSLGGLWVLAEGQGEMPGGGEQATMQMTLGYDPARGRFVGTFIGSMMTHLWIYEGTLDSDGRALTLETEGPVCDATGASGKLAKYRDVIELVGDDERRLTSHMLGEDGQWRPFMSASYRRRKS